MNWILIIALIIIAVLFFKAHELRHKFFAIIAVILLLFFLATFSQVVIQPGVDLKSFDGIVSAGKIYFTWLGQSYGNVKTITGNAVKMDWRLNINKTIQK